MVIFVRAGQCRTNVLFIK